MTCCVLNVLSFVSSVCFALLTVFVYLLMISVTIISQWQNNRTALESSGVRILEALKKGTSIAANPGESPPLAPDVANRCFQQLAHSYEEEYGGFRDAPKFPTPGRHNKTL